MCCLLCVFSPFIYFIECVNHNCNSIQTTITIHSLYCTFLNTSEMIFFSLLTFPPFFPLLCNTCVSLQFVCEYIFILRICYNARNTVMENCTVDVEQLLFLFGKPLQHHIVVFFFFHFFSLASFFWHFYAFVISVVFNAFFSLKIIHKNILE